MIKKPFQNQKLAASALLIRRLEQEVAELCSSILTTALLYGFLAEDEFRAEEVLQEETGKEEKCENSEERNFTGKLWDPDAELYYFNARWYDADTGRFITEDPIKDGLNWYVYANSNPIRFIDPTGLMTAEQALDFAESQGANREEINQLAINLYLNDPDSINIQNYMEEKNSLYKATLTYGGLGAEIGAMDKNASLGLGGYIVDVEVENVITGEIAVAQLWTLVVDIETLGVSVGFSAGAAELYGVFSKDMSIVDVTKTLSGIFSESFINTPIGSGAKVESESWRGESLAIGFGKGANAGVRKTYSAFFSDPRQLTETEVADKYEEERSDFYGIVGEGNSCGLAAVWGRTDAQKAWEESQEWARGMAWTKYFHLWGIMQ